MCTLVNINNFELKVIGRLIDFTWNIELITYLNINSTNNKTHLYSYSSIK